MGRLKKNKKTKTQPATPTNVLAAKQGHMGRVEMKLIPSPGIAEWLETHQCSIAMSTYQTGQLAVLGLDESHHIAYGIRAFNHAMGIAVDDRDLHLSTQNIIWHFSNLMAKGQTANGCDAVFAPRTSHVTGQLDVHDMAIESDGRLVFVNTVFSCLCTTAPGFSFQVLWKPDWISALAPEDRCHMNGLALRDGVARYITAVAQTDSFEGWRDVRVGGGILYDIVEERVIAKNLTMPHSPRWHDGAIYFINSGSGFLCRVEPSGDLTEVAFCPGFTRGLAIIGDYALVGTSEQRVNRTFGDLPLEKNLKDRGVIPECGIHFINIKTGKIEHQIKFSKGINEIYDIAILKNYRLPKVIGFLGDDLDYMINLHPQMGELKKASS